MRLAGPFTAPKLAWGIAVLLAALLATAASRTIVAAREGAVDPWTPEQTVQPAALAKELADSKPADKPVVVCVAPHALYLGGPRFPARSTTAPAARRKASTT